MAEKESDGEAGAGGGLIVPLLLAVVLGAGAGFGYGVTLGAPPAGKGTPLAANPGESAQKAQAAADVSEGAAAGKADASLKDQLVPLEPLIVNIGGAAGRWLRMEGVVAFAQPIKDGREVLIAQMNEDMMAYLRSASIAQVESPAGLEFLRDELTELVRLRTKGRARRFILRSLVIE